MLERLRKDFGKPFFVVFRHMDHANVIKANLILLV